MVTERRCDRVICIGFFVCRTCIKIFHPNNVRNVAFILYFQKRFYFTVMTMSISVGLVGLFVFELIPVLVDL